MAQSRNVPTKDELLEASYQVKSLAELNRFLNKGVTDNAVKKWCEKYEIYAQVKENFKTKRYPVIQCDMQGNEIKTWKDAYEAAQELGVTRTSIQSACSGIKGSCGGYKWKYKI